MGVPDYYTNLNEFPTSSHVVSVLYSDVLFRFWRINMFSDIYFEWSHRAEGGGVVHDEPLATSVVGLLLSASALANCAFLSILALVLYIHELHVHFVDTSYHPSLEAKRRLEDSHNGWRNASSGTVVMLLATRKLWNTWQERKWSFPVFRLIVGYAKLRALYAGPFSENLPILRWKTLQLKRYFKLLFSSLDHFWYHITSRAYTFSLLIWGQKITDEKVSMNHVKCAPPFFDV